MLQDLSGKKVGNYELRERLGRGGMAEVYKAYHASMDRFVAVKIMLGHLAGDDQFIKRFEREARATAKLRHNHIVQVFDFGQEDDLYYMVMEYIRGNNLKAVIQKRGKLEIDHAFKIASQLADALSYAHEIGMIHRDLKPANVMFTNDTDHQHSILTDFGIARILTETGLTHTGMSVGTPMYMSPEAGLGGDTDERSDLYALGVMMYEMITGITPYSADTPLAIIMKHVNAPLPSLKDLELEFPDGIERVILKSMQKDPADRYQTAAEMRDSIDEALHEYTTGAPTKEAVIAPQATKTAAAARTAAAVPKPRKSTGHHRTPKKRPPRQSQPQSNNLPWILLGVIGVIALLLLGGILALELIEDDEGEAPEVLTTQVVIAQPTNPPPPPTNVPPPTNEPVSAPPLVASVVADRVEDEFRILMGEVLEEEDWETAYRLAQRATRFDLNAQQYADIAYLAYANDDPEQAEEWALEAVELDPDEGSAYYLGALLAWQYYDDESEATLAFNQASELDYESIFINQDNDHEVNVDRGRMLADFDDHRAAVRSYDILLFDDDYDGDWAAAHVDKARSLIELGEYGSAQRELERALDVVTDPDVMEQIEELEDEIPEGAENSGQLDPPPRSRDGSPPPRPGGQGEPPPRPPGN